MHGLAFQKLEAKMSALLKRYKLFKDTGAYGMGEWMDEDSHGEYVLYADASALEARNGELETQIAVSVGKLRTYIKRHRIPYECFDGLAVYKAMTPEQLARNNPETVSDVLDVLVKLIRKHQADDPELHAALGAEARKAVQGDE